VYDCTLPPPGVSSCFYVSNDGIALRFEFRPNDGRPSRIVAAQEIIVGPDQMID
jgi:hypothetical protein